MPPRIILGKRAVASIRRAVEALFARAKVRLLGRDYGDKKIVFNFRKPTVGFREDLSLPGVFQAASRMEGIKPSEKVEQSLHRTAEGYLDAHREAAKVRVVNSVQNFLTEAELKGKPADVETVLKGELYEVFSKVTTGVKQILTTEVTKARNAGSLDAVVKIGAMNGIEDPVVYFVVVHDRHLCSECHRLHLMEDGMTPRLWYLSEVGGKYHKRGDGNPKISGLHPECRCTMVTLMPGYGFKGGSVAFIALGHDELALQRAA